MDTKSTVSIVLKYILIAQLITLATSIQLEGISTKQPLTTKYQLTITPSSLLDPNIPATPPPVPSYTPEYRLNASSGATCILLRTDALLNIKYRNNLGEDMEADSFVPDNAVVTGTCDEDSATMTISWRGFNLEWAFAKTPGGERWYVNKIELSYSTSNKLFEHVDKPNLSVSLATPLTLLFPTPVGKSHMCNTEQTIDLINYDLDSDRNHVGKLYLRESKLQAFMYKSDGTFGPPFECSLTDDVRSDTVPIAVGSALAIAALGTISGYAVFRHMKAPNRNTSHSRPRETN